MSETVPNRATLPDRPIFPQGSSGIRVSPLADATVLAELEALVQFFFPRPVEDYEAMDAEAYRSLVVLAQEELNRRDIGRRIAEDRRDEICAALDTQKPLIQTNVYLRGTRPNVSGVTENIGWHRESFYGPDMDQSVNVWLPIAHVSVDNIMQYIPDSHLIPDAEIETSHTDDPSVARFSAGHKIGLLYAPKEIVSGVDLTQARPFCVLPGEAVVFAGALIHGAAANNSRQIRFSVDFRMLAEESLSSDKQHFTSGKSYFEPL